MAAVRWNLQREGVLTGAKGGPRRGGAAEPQGGGVGHPPALANPRAGTLASAAAWDPAELLVATSPRGQGGVPGSTRLTCLPEEHTEAWRSLGV